MTEALEVALNVVEDLLLVVHQHNGSKKAVTDRARNLLEANGRPRYPGKTRDWLDVAYPRTA